jgi:subtilisin family serine protease
LTARINVARHTTTSRQVHSEELMKSPGSWAARGATAALATLCITGLTVVAQPATAAGPQSTYLVVTPAGNGNAKALVALRSSGATVVADYDKIGVVVAKASSDQADVVRRAGVGEVAATGALGTKIDEGETVAEAPTDASPTDEPLWGAQWDMRAIHVDAAHQITQGSKDVVVGVLDSGIAGAHPDLATQVDHSLSAGCLGGVADPSYAAWQPTTSDHGTHVAGTIAAADNGVGIVGIAPGVTLAAVKVVTDDGFIYPEAAVCGFMWAADHGFDLTNNSYFIDPWEFNCRNDAGQRAIWTAVQRAIRYSESRGVLNIAAAGNDNLDLQHTLTDTVSPDNSTPETREVTNACVDLPVEAPGVVAVAATGFTNKKSYYSSYGQGVIDVAAPGGDTRVRDYHVSTITDAILSTGINAGGVLGWNYKQGTSMASPHATGVAALALSAHPGLTPSALASFLERSATPLDCPPGLYDPRPNLPRYQATCSGGQVNSFYGHGLVDALAAVQ